MSESDSIIVFTGADSMWGVVDPGSSELLVVISNLGSVTELASRFFSELSTLNSFLEQNRLLNRFFLQLSYFNSFAIFSDNFTKPESNLTIFL